MSDSEINLYIAALKSDAKRITKKDSIKPIWERYRDLVPIGGNVTPPADNLRQLPFKETPESPGKALAQFAYDARGLCGFKIQSDKKG